MDNGASSYRRFLSGEKEGLSEIVCSYNDALIMYINSLVHNFGDAEELAADVFAKLIAIKPRYSGKSTFKTWLFAIARHTAIDFLKKSSRLSNEPIEAMYDISDGSDLEKKYLDEEQKIELHHALNKLNSEYSQVIYLSYFEGFSNAETAAIMKKSKRQVEKLLYNAKQSLKKILEKEGFEYEEL